MGDPEVIILDELTSGLDPQARRATWELVRAVRDAGTTVVLVTHFMDEAERLCDRLAVVDEGRIVSQGSPRDLIAGLGVEPRVRFTANASELVFLEAVAGVSRVTREGGDAVVHGRGPILARVASALAEHDIDPLTFEPSSPAWRTSSWRSLASSSATERVTTPREVDDAHSPRAEWTAGAALR